MPWTVFSTSVLLGETIFSEALGWIINITYMMSPTSARIKIKEVVNGKQYNKFAWPI